METVTVIIETSKGKGQKYDYDPQSGYFKLKKVLPAGLVFPFDFGYIPGTMGEDGDPVDAIVISEIETFTGCAMECRLIGAIKASQQERDGDTMRNDRYIAIPVVSVQYAHIASLNGFPTEMLDQLEQFFSNYNAQAGKKFKPLQRSTAQQASKLLEAARVPQMENNKLIQLYLPLRDTSGHAFPGSYFEGVKKTLTEKFGGLTVYSRSPAKGFWKEAEEKTQDDDVLIYEVLTAKFESDFWKDYKQKLMEQFKQEELLIRYSTVNLV